MSEQSDKIFPAISVLETERLWLRPFELSDAEQIQIIFSPLGVGAISGRSCAVALSTRRRADVLSRHRTSHSRMRGMSGLGR
jgi:hypothetical protein